MATSAGGVVSAMYVVVAEALLTGFALLYWTERLTSHVQDGLQIGIGLTLPLQVALLFCFMHTVRWLAMLLALAFEYRRAPTPWRGRGVLGLGLGIVVLAAFMGPISLLLVLLQASVLLRYSRPR